MWPTIIGLNDCSFLDAEEIEMQNHLDHVEWTQSFDTNCLSGWFCRKCKLLTLVIVIWSLIDNLTSPTDSSHLSGIELSTSWFT